MTPANREGTGLAFACERAATGATVFWMTGVFTWHAVRLTQAFLTAHGDAIQSVLRRLLGG